MWGHSERGMAEAAEAHACWSEPVISVPAAPQPAQADEREARFQRLLHQWWLDEQPPWTERGWWDATLRDDVRALLWLPAGPLLAGALAALEQHWTCPEPHVGENPPGQSAPGHAPGSPCACQVVVAAAWQACAGWAAAGSTESLVAAAGPEPVVMPIPGTGQQLTDPAREELAAALRMSPGSMGNRISAARELTAHPRLLAMVASAAISPWAARLVVLEVQDLTSAQAAAIVEQVCTKLDSRQSSGIRPWTSAEIGRAARMTRRRLCPDTDRAARERAFHRRRVHILPDKSGMATLIADLDETHAHRIHRRLSALARGLRDSCETRTQDQVRADAFVDLLLGNPASQPGASPSRGRVNEPPPGTRSQVAGSTATPPTDPTESPARPAPGPEGAAALADAALERAHWSPRAEIQVVVAWETLLALSTEPGYIPGLGPISPEIARELAADGRWRAWITDSRGAVVATSSATYVPNASLARLVRAREQHCRMPGCRRPAEGCDVDHAVPYPRGTTTAANLGPLCRRHHNLKTHFGWQLDPVVPRTADRRLTAERERSTPTLSQSIPTPAQSPPVVEQPSPPGQSPPASGRRAAQSAQPPPASGQASRGPGRYIPAPDLPVSNCPVPGPAAASEPVAWRWRTPSGFTIADEVEHPLQ